jgi:mitochondrial fission protein ELM1
MNRDPIIWALIDERPGTGNQCKGVAMALRLPFEEKRLMWSSLAFLPNFLFGSSLLGLRSNSKLAIKSPWPDLVIASGRRAAMVARYIKRKNPDKCSLVHIMYPGPEAVNDFDIIAVPNHDNLMRGAKNIIKVIGVPHNVDRDQLSRASLIWNDEFSNFKTPIVGLILGGATKRRGFTQQMAMKLACQTANLVNSLGGSLVITTSPRTGPLLTNLLNCLSEKNIKPAFIYDWQSDDVHTDNPYLGILDSADHLIVTGESTSMCSEACATDNIVHIFAPEGFLGQKHQYLIDELVSSGYAYLLMDGSVETSPMRATRKLDVAGQIAREIQIRILSKF